MRDNLSVTQSVLLPARYQVIGTGLKPQLPVSQPVSAPLIDCIQSHGQSTIQFLLGSVFLSYRIPSHGSCTATH